MHALAVLRTHKLPLVLRWNGYRWDFVLCETCEDPSPSEQCDRICTYERRLHVPMRIGTATCHEVVQAPNLLLGG